MRGGIEAAATLVMFLTIVVFPVGLAFLLLGPAGLVAALVVVDSDKRPLWLYLLLFCCVGVFGAATENETGLPAWLVTSIQAVDLIAFVSVSAYFVGRGLIERRQLA